MESKTSLVVMAAGIGSRYGGGVKQIDPLGPSGEIMMDYSVNDALEAGFNKVVFIIRRDLDGDFRSIIGRRIEKVTEVCYAYQELDDLPAGFAVPEGRRKPWGTGQALLSAKNVIREPFAVINADDYYGKDGYRKLHQMLTDRTFLAGNGVLPVAMTAFVLENTLSDNGGVTRGLVETDESGKLTGIRETKNIVRTEGGARIMTPGGMIPLDPKNLVSMNMWGLTPDFLEVLEGGFSDFLSDAQGDPLTKEYLLPNIIDRLVKEKKAEVTIRRTDDVWFGITYQEDRDAVRSELRRLTEEGIYRTPLFAQ